MVKSWNRVIKEGSYTDKDIVAIRDTIMDYVRESGGDLTDLNESSVLSVLVEVLSGTIDMMSYRLDRQALETYLSSAKQRKNVKSILSLLGYKMSGVTPSVGYVQAVVVPESLDPKYNSPTVTVPKYTQLVAYDDNDNRIQYTTTKSTKVPTDGTMVVVPMMQGSATSKELYIDDLKESGRVYLDEDGVVEYTVEVKVGNEYWSQVKDVTEVEDNQKVFSIHEDKYDRTYVLFHRNYQSMLPSGPTDKVVFTYVSNCLGSNGSVPKGAIRKSALTDYSILDDPSISSVIFYNSEATSGGSDRESIDEAKYNAPKVFKTLYRAVTLEDYNSIVNSYNDVNKALALDWNVDNGRYVSLPYTVVVYVVPSDGYTLSDNQKDDILDRLNNLKMASMKVIVSEPEYLDAELDIEVNIDRRVTRGYQYDEELKSLIHDTITEYYGSSEVNFGDGVYISNISRMIENLSSDIRSVNVLSPEDDITGTKINFPRVTISNISIVGGS